MKQIKFLLIYAKNYTGSLVLTVISMLLLVGVQLFIPWIIKTMIGAVTNLGGEQMSMALVTRLALLALAVYVARFGLQFLRSYMAHVAGWGVVADASDGMAAVGDVLRAGCVVFVVLCVLAIPVVSSNVKLIRRARQQRQSEAAAVATEARKSADGGDT